VAAREIEVDEGEREMRFRETGRGIREIEGDEGEIEVFRERERGCDGGFFVVGVMAEARRWRWC
jgi:hypothetical protein